jgi:leucyl aminopeptidase
MAANSAVSLNCKTVAIALASGAGKKFNADKLGQAITEGAYFGGYRYDEFISDCEKSRPKQLTVSILDTVTPKSVKVGNIIGQAQSFARTIANRPGNVINPPSLAAVAKKMANQTPGLSCTVFDDKKLKKMGAGGILAVGSGSATKPRMIVLKYNAPAKGGKKPATIGLVGKAITFDSGGISIKPSAGMEEMKFDKCGGIAVLGAMKAIAGLKPAVSVYGIIPSAENMPGGTSYRPGDIVTTLSGKTVEIDNTDAEGRMILCDAIHYAVTKKCDAIVDIATLTGACVVALGMYQAGLMGSDDKLIGQLKAAGEKSGEKVWHLPCDDNYLEEMKSKIADLKNIGSRWGGASTAAAFLKEFAADTNWAHIDMAGMMDGNEASKKLTGPGSIGYGVRLLTEFVVGQ